MLPSCDEAETWDFINSLLYFQTKGLLFLAFAAMLVNGGFLTFVVKGCRADELPVKRFMFVSIRACSDLVTSLVAFVYLMSTSQACRKVTNLGCEDKDSPPLPLQIAINLDYWTVALSYSGVALLTVFAVKDPIKYKTTLTLNHVLWCIFVSWGVMLAFLSLIYAAHWGGLVGEQKNAKDWMSAFRELFDTNGMIYLMTHGYHEKQLSYWQADLCHNIDRIDPVLMTILSLAIPVMLLILAIASYSMVAKALCSRRRSAVYRHNQAALLRLGMHLLIFSITVIVMTSAHVNTFPMRRHCQNKNKENSCNRLSSLYWYTLMNALSSGAWFLRMVADPMVDVLVDGVLRRSARSMFESPRQRLSTLTTSVKEEYHKLSLTRGSAHAVMYTENRTLSV